MSAPMEIEKKYLVAECPALDGFKAEVVRQGYITSGADSIEVRVRQKGQGYYITVKSKGTMARKEYETAIEEGHFNALWPATEGRRLEKTRYTGALPDGAVVELDIFDGHLAGLMLVEVEFASVEEAVAFTAPDWFGADVTEDKRYKNSALAVAPSAPE
ncbi:CYTH domain-containing protein [Donghicola sp. B5-SW-15]|uniref:CYTH domain-containing protein n=2 Tax=Donghicola mangrovi TaxID=2729614 RepID=A0A850QEE7_9RHOB|nr:CYTH domain-containing protein [Donghicola mangrovi]